MIRRFYETESIFATHTDLTLVVGTGFQPAPTLMSLPGTVLFQGLRRVDGVVRLRIVRLNDDFAE